MTSLADVIVADSSDLPGNPETARTALTEAVVSPPSTTDPAPTPTPSQDENVPEKFRGKSVKDVIEMYQNLESRAGAMANDLGVQRQLTDRLLDLKRSTDLQNNTPGKRRTEPVPVTANDILDRPQETLERVVGAKTAEVTEDVNARLAQFETRLAQQTFEARHPDYKSVVADPTFASWVQSSTIRLRAAAAANQGNWQIADELLSEFKTAQGGTRKTDQAPAKAEADLAGARRAALETSGSARGTDGKSTGGAKIYKRTDLMRLRITDPEAYYDEDFQNEILKAHSEHRVK